MQLGKIVLKKNSEIVGHYFLGEFFFIANKNLPFYKSKP
jgi:hypothetical protein